MPPAKRRRAERERNIAENDQCQQVGGRTTEAEGIHADGGNAEQAGQVEQPLRPGDMSSCLQQGLGEDGQAQRPECGQGDAVQPPGDRVVWPQILEAVAAHAQAEQQGAGRGEYVPEVGTVAQVEEQLQVVQQQRADQSIDDAEEQVGLDAMLLQAFLRPDAHGERIAGRVEGPGVDAQRPGAIGEAEYRAAVGAVASGEEGHLLAGEVLPVVSLGIGEIDAQVAQVDRIDFQPPVAG
ncbi:hypothetical protein D3C81_1162700 [compost metagenome]